MRKPLVLFDLRPVRTPISGVARYCIHLALGLSQRERDFTLKALYYGNRTTNEALRGVRDLALPAASTAHPKLLNAVLEYAPALSFTVVPGKFDLVHETYFANAYGTGRQNKIATIHDIIPIERPDYVNPRNRYFSQRNFKRQAREARHIISVSEYTKRKVMEFGGVPDERISVIPCGVTPAPDAQEPGYLAANGLEGKRFILFVGNIEPRKNIGVIAEALKSLGPSFDDVHFAVAGHLNYLAEPMIARGTEILGARFHFLGHVSEAQKWTLLKGARAFVFPSLYEGFGIPIVECYQARCPILIADNSALSELAVHPRQLFDAQSPAELAPRIAEALEGKPWVAESVEKGAATLPRYDWAGIASQTAALYDRLLA